MSDETKKILVTGGCGFIGTNFIRHMLTAYPRLHIVNLDKLTYAGNAGNLDSLAERSRYTFVKGDITDPQTVAEVMKDVQGVVHFAAETHVDRSIADPSVFVKTNVLGTYQLLESALRNKVGMFVHVSTDEVYGSLGPEGCFREDSMLAPNSPYSASKAGSDLLARSYFKTYQLPVVITRCSNNYGPYQFPEKLLPLMISRALADQKLPVYGDGQNVRDWLHVQDHCQALDLALHKGKPGEVYNIGGHNEWRNIDIVKLLLKKLGKPETLIEFVKDRPGHDRRYAIDSAKISRELGWKPGIAFEKGFGETVDWYVSNSAWLKKAAQ